MAFDDLKKAACGFETASSSIKMAHGVLVMVLAACKMAYGSPQMLHDCMLVALESCRNPLEKCVFDKP